MHTFGELLACCALGFRLYRSLSSYGFFPWMGIIFLKGFGVSYFFLSSIYCPNESSLLITVSKVMGRVTTRRPKGEERKERGREAKPREERSMQGSTELKNERKKGDKVDCRFSSPW